MSAFRVGVVGRGEYVIPVGEVERYRRERRPVGRPSQAGQRAERLASIADYKRYFDTERES
jgi:hypothetical protein